ncbi:hypothetical protein [Paraburkholderia silvatlantica]|uniref:Uncharacterized protein n=1 Tax=Paraburkholderia silvatlantica TaxID=321895 RepID=A0A2V4TSU1_9BURK|nr:hypothetical protein [Paraburkholderia silvatlantica]PYE21644.1 hypothetical protein C7410_11367 [Paraburkholderia silvatlantica]TDQ86767.1 hypothetical protein C7412_11667 [Paraburkholderia silvatlantica]
MSKLSMLSVPAWFARLGRTNHPPPTPQADEPELRDASRETEHLERIATYARAGYFNMGYTPDMFPLVGDLPPH